MMKSKKLLVFVCLIIGIVVINSCKKDVSLPVLTTTNPTNITINSVTSGGSITSSGGADITARGVCYSTSSNPTTTGTKTSDGKGSGSFASNITGLTPDTKYYIRAYATNSAGTAYGNEVSVTTTALVAPTVTTVAANAITLTTATSGGSITTDGGAAVSAKGVCWSITANPTVDDSKTSDGTGSTAFTSSLTPLTPGTTYYYRAYATNSVGTSYGNELTFTTTALGVPTVTTVAITTDITLTTATSGGDVTSNGGADVTARGVCWKITANPTTADPKTSDATGSGSFTSSLTNLLPGTEYHVRAYATNSVGTAYGADVTFTTVAVVKATVTTKIVSAILTTSATSGGDITDTGGGAIIEKGICWGITTLPTVSGSHTTDGSGTETFTSNMTSLLAGTLYYVRAYATNSAGTAYGNEQTFTTTAVAFATVATTDPSLVTTTTARSGGTISSAGGGTISAKGVCWSTSANPTTADPKTSDGTGTTAFVSNLTSLLPGTPYHVRAYAINEAGPAYGEDKVFTTVAILMPAVTTDPISDTTATSAVSGGNVTNDGNGTITAGVCWATTTTPLSTGLHTTDGTGTGAFVSHITGLTPNTTYYVRAYATNSAGTSYGTEYPLPTPAATDADGNNYKSIVIGTQIWLRQNLKTTKYNNGDPIGTTTPATLDLTGAIAPKYQWNVGNDPTTVAVYGRFYTWYTVTDSRGVCPTGWHVPTDPEMTTFTTFLGGEAAAGIKVKEVGTDHWNGPNTNTNESGFTAVGGGYRNFTGAFVSFGVSSPYWTSTENLINTAWGWGRTLYYNQDAMGRNGFDKPDGCVVRCIKDAR